MLRHQQCLDICRRAVHPRCPSRHPLSSNSSLGVSNNNSNNDHITVIIFRLFFPFLVPSLYLSPFTNERPHQSTHQPTNQPTTKITNRSHPRRERGTGGVCVCVCLKHSIPRRKDPQWDHDSPLHYSLSTLHIQSLMETHGLSVPICPSISLSVDLSLSLRRRAWRREGGMMTSRRCHSSYYPIVCLCL